ncbi:MAG: hypothetical protein ABIY55_34225 [Kofleriaceae bacterium]
MSLTASICAPAIADRARSLAECTSFDQANAGDAKVAFTIHNTCTIPIDCAVSWRVVCAPDSKKRRTAHPSSAKFALTAGGGDTAEASAAACGDDGWTIDSVQWSCAPNKE